MMFATSFDVLLMPVGWGELPGMASPASWDGARSAMVSAGGPEDKFARMAGLIRSNDRHLAELRALDARLAEARQYLATPSANLGLGHAYRDRVQGRRARVLTILRANRLAAREFLAV